MEPRNRTVTAVCATWGVAVYCLPFSGNPRHPAGKPSTHAADGTGVATHLSVLDHGLFVKELLMSILKWLQPRPSLRRQCAYL